MDYTLPPNYRGPVNPNPTDGEAPISIFGYTPDRALGCIAVIVFALALLTHFVYLIRLRETRSFQILMVIGCAMEVGGYIVRILAHYNPFLVSYYVAQYFLVVVAPSFISSAFYLSLVLAIRRLPNSLAHGLLSFSPKTFVVILIVVDFCTIAVQVVGAALIGVAESARTRNESAPAVSSKQANDILLAGLAAQAAGFIAFLGLLGLVSYRSNQLRPHPLPPRFVWALIVSSFFILLRTTFRTAETAQGVFGTASTSEVLFGVLEFAPVAIAVSIWGALSLDSLLPQERANHEIEKWDGRKASFGALGPTISS